MGDHDDIAGEGGACDENSAAEEPVLAIRKRGGAQQFLKTKMLLN